MKKILLILPLLALSACATVITGLHQDLFVDTPEAHGAKCQLKDEWDGEWYVEKTPQTVEVRKGFGNITIICIKDGYKRTTAQIEELPQGIMGINAVFGPILGAAGAVTDAATGSAQYYPESVRVWMEPNVWPTGDSKEAWLERQKEYDHEEVYQEIKKSRPENR